MGLWDAASDLDYRDEFWLRRTNATCTDCGAGFVKGRDDVGDLCDTCVLRVSDERKRMAKATLNKPSVASPKVR